MPIPTNDPIVCVPVATPFDEEDQVDLDAVGRNVERWLKTPLTCFIVGTATGEEWYLCEQEKLEIARAVRDAVDDRRCVIGGIDCPSVTETLRRAEAFAEAGAEMLRVRLPRYESTVESYFEQVLSRCPLPVVLMHQTAPELFGAAGRPAASEHIIGRICNMDGVFGYTTDHDMRFEARVRKQVPADRRFWICNGSMILSGTVIGCNGTTTAIANVLPGALDELLRLGMAGKYDEAQPLQEKVERVDAVMLPYISAGVKAALGLLGFEGMRPRSPIAPMPADAVAKLETVMRDCGFLPE
ncbi:MAG: dihydrodipicolinate synthase family protein [Planctomycetales bacterium]